MRPRKAFYRARAHSNPFNDTTALDTPPNPDAYDWSQHYPERCSKPGEASTSGRDELVRFADIGCGFGGLLVK